MKEQENIVKKTMEKIYGNLKMSWPVVIIFAIAAGVYTGAIMLVPALKDTSFTDIGAFVEWWVIFAVIIVTNCKKNYEAMLKCFVFFLISQPLIYAVEILFGTLTVDLAWQYYRNMWLPATILTLPGGLIAYYCKKQNSLGAIILGVGNTFQIVMGASYIVKTIKDFPHHILSAVVCFASILIMSFGIQKEKKNRLISILIPVALLIIVFVFMKLTGRVIA